MITGPAALSPLRSHHGQASSFIFLQNWLTLPTLQQLLCCLFTSHASARLLIFCGTSYLVVINTSNTEDTVLMFADASRRCFLPPLIILLDFSNLHWPERIFFYYYVYHYCFGWKNKHSFGAQFGQKRTKSLPLYVVSVSLHSLESNKWEYICCPLSHSAFGNSFLDVGNIYFGYMLSLESKYSVLVTVQMGHMTYSTECGNPPQIVNSLSSC